jgi:hypothetical protein
MRAQIQDMSLNQFIWDFVIDMGPLKFSGHVTQTASDSPEPQPQSLGVQETYV